MTLDYCFISVAETKKLLLQGQVIVGDVRCEDDYEKSHIKTALLFDRPGLYELVSCTDRSIPIIVYCYHGRLSRLVAYYLIARGFKQVYSLTGGFAAWCDACNELVAGE